MLMSVIPVFDYEVQTYTANVPGADTDAHVYITLFGERGDSGKRLLFQSNHRNKFQEGQVMQLSAKPFPGKFLSLCKYTACF